ITNRRFYVSMNGLTSPTFSQKRGVPQGAILSPALLNIFISDFPMDSQITTYLYAHDIAFFIQGSNANALNNTAQHYLNRIQQWASENRLKFNVNKCYTLKCRNNVSPCLVLCNSVIHVHESIKYMGMLLDYKLKWQAHLEAVMFKASRAAAIIQHD